MRAFRYHSFGPVPGPVVEETPVPVPSAGELLVRVAWASLNPVDWKIADGTFRLLAKGGLPRTLGADFAGDVAAVGPQVQGWRVGEAVMGFVDPFARPLGTFAEYVPVPAAFVTRRPPDVDPSVAAALPCVGVTAVTLCDLAQVGRDARVLVNGASGGVGHLAVQVARARGAEVTATASAARRGFVESLGAQHFVDYRVVPPERWPAGFDAVLDCVPNLRRAQHRRLLRRGGHYASTLPGPATFLLDPWLNRVGPVRRHAVFLRPSETAYDELRGLLQRGRLRCAIEREYCLEDAPSAIACSREGRVAGKLVIRVA